MITYILLLTLVMGDYRSGPTVTSVPGFSSLESCDAAARKWEATRPQYSHLRTSAICVEQDTAVAK